MQYLKNQEPSSILLYVTCPDERLAEQLSQELIKNRLAACTNIYSGMKSYYWWKGKLESANEVVLIIKTRVQLSQQCQSLILKHHPYTVPCILEIPVLGGHPAYLKWLAAETIAPNSKEP